MLNVLQMLHSPIAPLVLLWVFCAIGGVWPGFPFGMNLESRASVLFPSAPPRIEQYYEAILALWNQLYINMKSLVSWHYCMIDIEKIKTMTIAKVRPQDHPLPGGAPQLLPDVRFLPGKPSCAADASLRGSSPSNTGWEGFTPGRLRDKQKY